MTTEKPLILIVKLLSIHKRQIFCDLLCTHAQTDFIMLITYTIFKYWMMIVVDDKFNKIGVVVVMMEMDCGTQTNILKQIGWIHGKHWSPDTNLKKWYYLVFTKFLLCFCIILGCLFIRTMEFQKNKYFHLNPKIGLVFGILFTLMFFWQLFLRLLDVIWEMSWEK